MTVVPISQQSPEVAAFARYKALFEQVLELRADLKEIDEEYKEIVADYKATRRLADLAARDAIKKEARKLKALQAAAAACGQLSLFGELDTAS